MKVQIWDRFAYDNWVSKVTLFTVEWIREVKTTEHENITLLKWSDGEEYVYPSNLLLPLKNMD